MRLRTLVFAALAAGLWVNPAPAPPPPTKAAPAGDRPAVVFQVLSINHILEDIRGGTKFTGGPLGDKFLDEFNNNLEKAFGKEGFDGIDPTKPAGGYLIFNDNLEAFACVLLFPATDEKKLLTMIGRSPVQAKSVAGNPGLFQLVHPNDDQNAMPIRLRLHDGYAYLGFNTPDAAMSPQALITAAKVIDPNEKATAVARGLPGKVPAGLYKTFRDSLAEGFTRDKMRAERSGEKWGVELISAFEALIFKGLTHLETDTDSITWRLNFDRKTGTFTDEETFVPKAGTSFATEIEKWGTTTNRFAGMADDKAAAWGVTKIPVFNEEVRKIFTALLDGAEKEYPGLIPDPAHGLIKEAIALGKRTVAKGEGDIGLALHGPGKEGLFTLSAAIVADDPSGFENELRAMAKDDPVKGLIVFDVAKVGDVGLHDVKIGAFLPPELQKLFGKDAMGCLGIGKTALFLAVGPECRAKVTAAAGMKPGPASAFDIRYNPVKITAFAKTVEATAEPWFAGGLGTEDKMVPFWTATVTGGTNLTIKQTSNLLSGYRVVFFMMEGLLR